MSTRQTPPAPPTLLPTTSRVRPSRPQTPHPADRQPPTLDPILFRQESARGDVGNGVSIKSGVRQCVSMPLSIFSRWERALTGAVGDGRANIELIREKYIKRSLALLLLSDPLLSALLSSDHCPLLYLHLHTLLGSSSSTDVNKPTKSKKSTTTASTNRVSPSFNTR